MKELTLWALIIAILALVIWGIFTGIDRGERAECFKWQRHSDQFVGFYLTEWQKAQCDYHGIEINAPVR